MSENNPVREQQLQGMLVSDRLAQTIGLGWMAICGMLTVPIIVADPGLRSSYSQGLLTFLLSASLLLMVLVGLAAAVHAALMISRETLQGSVDLIRLSSLTAGAIVYGYVIAVRRHLGHLRWLLLGAVVGGWISTSVLKAWMFTARSPDMLDWLLSIIISLTVTLIPAVVWGIIMLEFMDMAMIAGVTAGLLEPYSQRAVLRAVLISGAGIGLLVGLLGMATLLPVLLVLAVLGAALVFSKGQETLIKRVVHRWECR